MCTLLLPVRDPHRPTPQPTHFIPRQQLLDTAGVDDVGELGEKKKAKSLGALREVDLALLVIDPFVKTTANKDTAADPAKLALLGSLVAEVTRRGRQVREKLCRGFARGASRRHIR